MSDDDQQARGLQPPVSWQISRRRFVSGSVAVVGGVALLGRTGLAPHRLVSAPAGPAGFSLVQASAQASATGSVTLALPNAASTPGSLLVATVMSPAASTPFTPPSGPSGTGWQLGRAVSCAGGRVEQWYWANNPGGLYGPGSGAVFTGAAGASCRGGIAELSTPAGSRQVLDTLGQVSGTGYGTSMPVACAGGVFVGTLGVFSEAEFFASSIGSAGASWTNPGGYAHLASLANNAVSTWAHSYNGNLAAGYQNPSGGLSYSGPVASTGWAALLCCYRAVKVSPINWCGAEVTNCLALDAAGQQLIVGGDVEGIFRTANFGDNWQPSDYGIETGARQSFAFVAWSELEPGYVYAGGGHSAGDGAFLVSKDGGATWWSQRSKTTIWWYGNATPAQPQGPRPSATPSDQDRSVGRLLAQDPVGGVLYSATGSDGVMQSTDNGVTWTSIGLSGSGYWPRCIVLNPANGSELWAGHGIRGTASAVCGTTPLRRAGASSAVSRASSPT